MSYFISFTLGSFAGVFISFGLPLPALVVSVIALGLFAVVTRHTEPSA